jgi:hypothetical protein
VEEGGGQRPAGGNGHAVRSVQTGRCVGGGRHLEVVRQGQRLQGRSCGGGGSVRGGIKGVLAGGRGASGGERRDVMTDLGGV